MKNPEEIKKIAEDYANNELSIYPDKSENLSQDEIHRIKTVVFSHSYIGFKNGYTQCQQNNADKKYTEEDMVAFAYQFSSINVSDFRKHLKDFDLNLKEKNKQD